MKYIFIWFIFTVPVIVLFSSKWDILPYFLKASMIFIVTIAFLFSVFFDTFLAYRSK